LFETKLQPIYLLGLKVGVSLLLEEADKATTATAATAPNMPIIRSGLKPLELLESTPADLIDEFLMSVLICSTFYIIRI
jgi:hypothetical protein